MTDLTAGTTYQFQLRHYDDGAAGAAQPVYASEYYVWQTKSYAAANLRVSAVDLSVVSRRRETAQTHAYQIQWDNPVTPNGDLKGYRVFYCAPSVAPQDCTESTAAGFVPSNGETTRKTSVFLPDDGQVIGDMENHTFVVETQTILIATDRLVSSMSEPLTLSAAGSQSLASSSGKVGSATTAAIVLGIVGVAFLVVILVIVMKNRQRRTGASNLNNLNGTTATTEPIDTDMEMEPIKRKVGHRVDVCHFRPASAICPGPRGLLHV